jgi:hypothetical protein
MAESYSVEWSGAGDVGQMSNFWTHFQTEAVAAASLRFDLSVSFRLVEPVQQQEYIYPQIFSVNKSTKKSRHLTKVKHRRLQLRCGATRTKKIHLLN